MLVKTGQGGLGTVDLVHDEAVELPLSYGIAKASSISLFACSKLDLTVEYNEVLESKTCYRAAMKNHDRSYLALPFHLQHT